jgi:hypothetical protein
MGMVGRRRFLLLAGGCLASWAAGVLALLLLWSERDPVQECYGPLRVGGPVAEAEGLLAKFGFRFVGGGEMDLEQTLVFRRGQSSQTIILTVELPDGIVSSKDLEGAQPRESFLDRLRRLFRL